MKAIIYARPKFCSIQICSTEQSIVLSMKVFVEKNIEHSDKFFTDISCQCFHLAHQYLKYVAF